MDPGRPSAGKGRQSTCTNDLPAGLARLFPVGLGIEAFVFVARPAWQRSRATLALQRAELTVGELARIALLEFIEHRPAVPFRLRRQPLADPIPDCCERVLARAVGPQPP